MNNNLESIRINAFKTPFTAYLAYFLLSCIPSQNDKQENKHLRIQYKIELIPQRYPL